MWKKLKSDLKSVGTMTWIFIVAYLVSSLSVIHTWYLEGDITRVIIWSLAIVFVSLSMLAIEISSNEHLKMIEDETRAHNKWLLDTINSITEADITTEERMKRLNDFEKMVGVKRG